MSVSIQLSRLEYDIAWELARLGPHPPVLELTRGHGHTVDERRALTGQVWTSLRGKGLVDGPGRLDDDLMSAFMLLGRPQWEVDARLRLSPDGPPVRALAAARHHFAVLAVLDHEALTIQRIPSSGLAAAVVGLLPAHPPARGGVVRVPADVLDDAANQAHGPGDLVPALLRSDVERADAEQIAASVTNVIRMGSFGAAYTSDRRHGGRERASYTITFYDTPYGRSEFSRIPAGSQYSCTLQPSDRAKLTARVAHLLTRFDSD